MQIIVNGETRELTAIDREGNDFTKQLLQLGDFDGLRYDENLKSYVTDKDGFKLWELRVKMSNETSKLEASLDDDGWEAYVEFVSNHVVSPDLDMALKQGLEWLKNYAKK